MNLVWVAAVLRPDHIAPHPNDEDIEYESREVARLAAVVTGHVWRLYRLKETLEGEGGLSKDGAIANVIKSLDSKTVEMGVQGLSEEILSSPPRQHARSCALGLLACAAAAEIDDYDTCDFLLQTLLDRTVGTPLTA